MAKKIVAISAEKKSADSEHRTCFDSKWRNLVAYWILGLCNNYGYVIMLSAAHDILKKLNEVPHPMKELSSNNATTISQLRSCNTLPTGAILLADIVPCLLIKLTSPFLPFFVNMRMTICVLFAALAFVVVSQSVSEWLILIGVILTSISSGLGEATLLSYSQRFSKNLLSTWSSGTGGAGIIGALSYATFKTWLSVEDTLLIMLVIPLLQAIAFWLILIHPPRASKVQKCNTDSQLQMVESPKKSFIEKLRLVPQLFKYMIPLGLVYFFEYFINQGLYELVEFKGIWLDHDAQYRWLQVDYQIGVFISRSSVNIIQIKYLWLMSILQFINVLIILFEALYYYIPSFYIVLIIVLWEGMLGGGAYVNTLYRMSTEIRWEDRESALGIVTIADAVGIALAGWASIPVHDVICRMPQPKRLTL